MSDTDAGRVASDQALAVPAKPFGLDASRCDPSRMEELAEYMRRMARSHSEAAECMARTKSIRQGHNPPRDDLYMWPTPEQTHEWEIADILAAIAMETRQGRDAKQGSVEDDSAAIAQNPPSGPSERNA